MCTVKLLGYQQRAVDIAVERMRSDKCTMLAFEMGLGKTYTALAIIREATEQNIAKHALVVAPSALITGWNTSAERCGVEIFCHSYDARHAPPITSDTVLVLDESHYIKNKNGGRWKRLQRAFFKTNLRLLLTGTPMPNRHCELWTQMKLLGMNMDWIQFTKKYCGARHRHVRHGRLTRRVWDVSRSTRAQELRKLTITLGVIYECREHALPGFPGLSRRVVWVPGGNAVQKPGATLVDYATTAVTNRTTNAALWDKLVEIASQTWRTMIFAKHSRTLDNIVAAMDAANMPHVRIDGKNSRPARRQATLDDAARQEIRVVCSIGAVSTGLNAQSYSEMIFVECTWSGGERLQCEARIHRMGQEHHCTVTYLLVDCDVDRKLWKSLSGKDRRISNLTQAGALNTYLRRLSTATC